MSIASRTIHALVGLSLAATLVVTMTSVAAASVATQGGACSWKQAQAGLCGSDGTGITIIGTEVHHEPGSDGSDGSTPVNESGGGDPDPDFIPDDSQPTIPLNADALLCHNAAAQAQSPTCLRATPAAATPAPDAAATPATPGRSIVLSDLARFVPADTTLSGEPQNVAVVGLPANFLSTARTQTVPGTILGRALTIRFTPVSHSFDYGDGERRDSATPGTSWEAAGQPQFTPTDTSHVYRTPGTFTTTVTVTYSAEIDLGSGWQPISGTLTGPPSSQDIRVVTARTALVLSTCLERPAARGC